MTLAPVFAVWRTAVVNWGVWYGPVAWAAEMFAVAHHRALRALPAPPYPAGAADRDAEPSRRTVDILIPTVNEPLPCSSRRSSARCRSAASAT